MDTVISMWKIDNDISITLHYCLGLYPTLIVHICGDIDNYLYRHNIVDHSSYLLVYDIHNNISVLPILISLAGIEIQNILQVVKDKISDNQLFHLDKLRKLHVVS